MQRFKGKVAVVTGASSGIGKAMSKELMKRGLVVIGLARRMEKLQQLEQELKSEITIGKFSPIKCDITKEEDIRNTFDYINKHEGAPSILVNNAGVTCDKKFHDLNGCDFDEVFETNTRGLFLASKEAICLMEKSSIAGHILNINSIVGHYMPTYRNAMFYAASKYASRIFSESMRRLNVEKKGNIKISNISPGLTETELTKNLPYVMPKLDNPNTSMTVEDVVKACISVLDTAPNVLISELIIMPIHQVTG